jgi:hypothetical protein
MRHPFVRFGMKFTPAAIENFKSLRICETLVPALTYFEIPLCKPRYFCLTSIPWTGESKG